MKIVQAILITGFTILFSCNGFRGDVNKHIRSFIPGEYVRSFENEDAVGKDTLLVDQPDANNNYYTIQHKVAYQRKENGLLLPLECKTENWVAIFNDETNLLEEQQKGKMFSVMPDKNALLLGSNKYLKIK